MDNEELRSLVDPCIDEWYLKRCGEHPKENQYILKLCSNRVTIGRLDSMTHTLNSPFISKEHAVFVYKKDSWYIEDKSLNGLYVNNSKIPSKGKILIAKGDVIGFGLPIKKQNEANVFVYVLCQNSNHLCNAHPYRDDALSVKLEKAVPVKSENVNQFDDTKESDEDCFIISTDCLSSYKSCDTNNVKHIPKIIKNEKQNEIKPYAKSLSLRSETTLNPIVTPVNQQEETIENSSLSSNNINNNLEEKLSKKMCIEISKCKFEFNRSKCIDCSIVNSLKENTEKSINNSDINLNRNSYQNNERERLCVNPIKSERLENSISSEPDEKLKKTELQIVSLDESEDELPEPRFLAVNNKNCHSKDFSNNKEINNISIKNSSFNQIASKIIGVNNVMNNRIHNFSTDDASDEVRSEKKFTLSSLITTNCETVTTTKLLHGDDDKKETLPMSVDSSELKHSHVKTVACTDNESLSLKSTSNSIITKNLTDNSVLKVEMISVQNIENVDEIEIITELDHDNRESQNGYTQEDEIIIISDDDEDYFNSSQQLSNDLNTYIKCKKEDWAPDEVAESIYDIKDGQNAEDISDITHNGLTSCLPIESLTNISENGAIKMKNFEELKDKEHEQICNNSDVMNDYLKLQEPYVVNDINNECFPLEDNDEPFFPILSQSFYSDDDDDDDDDDDENEANEIIDNNNVSSTKELSNVSEVKKKLLNFNGTKFIEALPLINKRKTNAKIPTCYTAPEKFYKQTNEKKNFEKDIRLCLKKKDKSKKSLNLKEQIKKNLGYRIPIPGGGSDIQSSENKTKKLKEKIKLKKSSILPLKKISKGKLKEIDLFKKSSSSPDAITKKKSKTKSRFENRGLFLTEAVHLSNVKGSKTTFKIPKKSSNQSIKSDIKNNNKTLPNIIENNISKDLNDMKISDPLLILQEMDKIKTDESMKPSNCINSEKLNSYVETINLNEKMKRQSECTSHLPAKKVRFSDKTETHIIPRNLKSDIKKTSVLPSRNIDGVGPNLKIPATTNIQDILFTIISWNPSWLIEQDKNPLPPPIIDYSKLWPTLLCYESYSDYLRIFQPLLLLETWAQITREWQSGQGMFLTYAVAIQNTFYGSNKNMSLQTMTFMCKTLCTAETVHLHQYPQEGHLVILDVPLNHSSASYDNPKKVQVIFGLIEAVSKCPIQLESQLPSVLQTHSLANFTNTYLLSFTIKCKFRQINVDVQKLMRIKVLSYLKPTFRQFKALFFLPRSILARDILKPRLRAFSIVPSSFLHLKAKESYNRLQRDSILGITDACCQGASPKISLIQGPPGTGKSHTIIGLIQQILYGDDIRQKCGMQPKILLTAPSNAAVDELMLRLIKLKQSFGKERRLRFVRIGQMNYIHPIVKEYTLNALIKSNMSQKIKEKKTLESVETELKTLEAKANELQNKIKGQVNQGISSLHHELMDVNHRISRLKNQKSVSHLSQSDLRKEEYELTRTLLENADIIATTLSSCRQSQMETVFSNRCVFTACIIDEASQCIEQDTLLPLMFGISKLILIGDPKQLPATVLSKKAQEMGLNQSLFERFHRYFINNNLSSPILMLSTQYRMHPEICSFPSKCFYGGKLETDRLLEMKYNSCPLNPYLLFDIHHGQENSNKGEIYNMQEVEFIMEMLDIILKHTCLKLSVGIITPYHAQKIKLKEALRTKYPNDSFHINVNTIDGFQGKERDVIIFSTVRAKNINGSIGFLNEEKRLNVALTRAKQCFYICGHLSSLKVNEYWRALIVDADERGKIISVNSEMKIETLKHTLLKNCV